jgi:hypothetical protein
LKMHFQIVYPPNTYLQRLILKILH